MGTSLSELLRKYIEDRRLSKRVKELETSLAAALESAAWLKLSSNVQGHSAHWDRTMSHGVGCRACYLSRVFDQKAKAALDSVGLDTPLVELEDAEYAALDRDLV